MRSSSSVPLFLATAAAAAAGFTMLPSVATADDTIRAAGDHPHYVVEVEPQFASGWDVWALGWGFGAGAGVRASIPVMNNGFVRRINNVPAITFGFDWMHFENGCYYRYADYCIGASANDFYFPVGLQWNLFIQRRWSFVAELGVAPYYRGYTDSCGLIYGVATRDYVVCENAQLAHVAVTPWGALGARFHFNDHVALTMRAGIPSLSVGVSFM